MRLRVNGPVPGKRPKRNPWTCSGYPQWNTFDGLGVPSTAKSLNMARRQAGLQGGKSRCRHRRRLAPENLMHRVKVTDYANGSIRKAFEDARVISLKIDRAAGQDLAILMRAYNNAIDTLVGYRAFPLIDELTRLERARGVFRFKQVRT
jgi:hypothetical protein